MPAAGGETEKAFRVSYNQYLYVFLLLGFGKKDVQEKMYIRTANIIQTNLNYIIGGDGTKTDWWQKEKAFVYFTLEAEIRVKPLMLTIPIASRYSENPKDSTDWCTFTYKTARGYS